MPENRVSDGRLRPLVEARGDEHVRNAPFLQVLPDGAVRLIAEARDDGENLVLLHLLADHLQRVRRVVVVVADDELDLAPVDASLRVVDVVEVGAQPVGDRRVGGGGAPAHRQVRPEAGSPCRSRPARLLARRVVGLLSSPPQLLNSESGDGHRHERT